MIVFLVNLLKSKHFWDTNMKGMALSQLPLSCLIGRGKL